MFVERASRILKHFMPAVWSIKDGTKSVYLTFDDGPCAEITPKVLDILKFYNVKATFFCVGENVKNHSGVFRQIIKDGHTVGNHTMHHIKGFNTKFADYIADIEEADSYIKSPLLRPPYGRITLKQLAELKKKYKIIMWDVITRDYNTKLNPEKCFSIVKRFTQKGSIIVFHDSVKASKNMLVALQMSIEWLKSKGYEFKIIS